MVIIQNIFIFIYLFFNLFLGPFKIIKALLPANAVEILKLVDSKTLKEYIDEDNMLKCWGGKDDYVYSFEFENFAQVKSELTPSITNKKVNFCDKIIQCHLLCYIANSYIIILNLINLFWLFVYIQIFVF